MELLKLLIICIEIVIVSQGGVTEHNEVSNIDCIKHNLDENYTQNMPRNLKKREHSTPSNFVQLRPLVTVPRATLQPNLKLNLKLNNAPALLPMKRTTDSMQANKYVKVQSDVQKPKVATTGPTSNKEQTISIPVDNVNGNMKVVKPKESKSNAHKVVEFYEDPVEIPGKFEIIDGIMAKNDPMTKSVPIKLDYSKVNADIVPKNLTEIESKAIHSDIEKCEVNVSKNGNFIVDIAPKNMTKLTDTENPKRNKGINTVEEPSKASFEILEQLLPTQNNTDKNTLKLTNILKNNNENEEMQPKDHANNDTNSHITIHDHNYEEIVQKMRYDPRQSVTQDQYPENTIAYPNQEWSYENPYNNINQYFTMNEIDSSNYQSDYEYPKLQYRAKNNEHSSNMDDIYRYWNYYQNENNKYVIRRSWKNTDITINSNNKPMKADMGNSNEVPLEVVGYRNVGNWINLPMYKGDLITSNACYSNQNTPTGSYRYFN